MALLWTVLLVLLGVLAAYFLIGIVLAGLALLYFKPDNNLGGSLVLMLVVGLFFAWPFIITWPFVIIFYWRTGWRPWKQKW